MTAVNFFFVPRLFAELPIVSRLSPYIHRMKSVVRIRFNEML